MRRRRNPRKKERETVSTSAVADSSAARVTSRRALWLLWAGIGVFTLGIIVVGVFFFQERLTRSDLAATVAAIETQMPSERTPAPNGGSANGALPAVNAQGKDFVGILGIPALGRSLPVLSEAYRSQQTDLPVAFAGSPRQGNFVVAGPNVPGVFANITDLADGSVVTFVDVDATVYTFEVLTVESVDADNYSSVLDRGDEWDLSVVTPSFSGRENCVIRCKAIF